MENLVKTTRKKAKKWWLYFITITVLVTGFMLWVSVKPITDLTIIFSVFLGVLLGVCVSLLFISITYQPVYRKQNKLKSERFEFYYNSCVKYLKVNEINKAVYFYDYGLRFYNDKNTKYYDRQLLIRGVLLYSLDKLGE